MSKITAEKKTPAKQSPSVPLSMTDIQCLAYVDERCQILFQNSTYDNEEVQEALKSLGQLYFNYKSMRSEICDKLISLKIPGNYIDLYKLLNNDS